MGHIVNAIDGIVGGTPLVRLARIEQKYGLKSRLLAKVEALNPTGSVKDRAALYMLDAAEKEGKLRDGGTIIEPTSGNTGIGLAALGAARGYKVIIVMPSTMSVERRKIIAAYGAEIVLSDGAKGMKGAIERAYELADSIPGSFIPMQFDNAANVQAHFETTGPEIYNDCDGNVDVFVAGVGTGGTITGVGKYLKGKNSAVRVVAVEPADSPVLSGGAAGKHAIQGIGAGFVPSIFDMTYVDEIYQATNDEAVETARTLAYTQGILAGISSGAALSAAISVAKREEYSGRTVVVVLPDSGDRYLSLL